MIKSWRTLICIIGSMSCSTHFSVENRNSNAYAERFGNICADFADNNVQTIVGVNNPNVVTDAFLLF